MDLFSKVFPQQASVMKKNSKLIPRIDQKLGFIYSQFLDIK